ncbi:MAG: tetratricopeptide repeat protein [Calditrichia bacterium]
MKRLILIFSALFLFSAFLQTSYAADREQAALFNLLEKGKRQLYHFRLDSAMQIFRQVQQQFPEYPHGFFYEAYLTAIYYSQDRTNSELDSRLQEAVEKAIDIGKEYESRSGKSADALYYLGVSNGIQGIYHVLNRSYFKGYINGRRGKNYLEKVVETDSAYYDAYLGLGIFHYYVDLLPGLVKFFAGILGFHGNRGQGMREIQLTASRGSLFHVEGQFVFATIRYFLEGNRSGGLQIFEELRKAYPDNPALTLIIGYHYRRSGNISRAIRYFREVPDAYMDELPQITVVKHYNLVVCNFRLNKFQKAETLTDSLITWRIRKTPYYQAALAFYKGLLLDLRFEREQAEYFYNLIRDEKETDYWYAFSRIFVNHPMDSMLYRFVAAENNLLTGNRKKAEPQIQKLVDDMLQNPRRTFSDLQFLVQDLYARLLFARRDFPESAQIYAGFIDNLNNFEDKFQRSWIYIHYARVLRELQSWESAGKMLEKAEDTDDEYTHIIIEREKFLLQQRQEQFKS